MKIYVLLPIFFFTSCWSATSSRPRFSVYWNVPDRCSKIMKEPNYFSFLNQFNIMRNSNGNIWGDSITIIYSTSFKFYPYLKINDTTRKVIEEVDGGIPQKTNFTAFFSAAEELIKERIPDPSFAGPAVLDFEEYRFLYQYNWGVRMAYQKLSDEHTALKYPNISGKAVRARSEYEFNKASRRTILGLLRLGKRLRPHAQWGYYLMPECSGHYEMESTQCTGLYNYNEELTVLFNEQTGLYPSIYFENESSMKHPNYRSTQVRMREARRFSLTQKGRLPIYAYSKIEYDAYRKPTWYYTKADLCAAFQGAFEEGTDGIIIWGPDRQPWKERCPALKNYIMNTLGPLVINMQRKAEKCSKKMCSGNGKCLRIGDLAIDCKWSMKEKLKDMACLCDNGYYGQKCEYHRRAPKISKDKSDPKKLSMKKLLQKVTEVENVTTRPDFLQAIALLPPPF